MQKIINYIKFEISNFIKINPANKTWQLSFILALSSGLPLFIGTYLGHFEFGVISSMGGMCAFYMQKTALIHRIVVLLCVSTALGASFFIGLLMAHFPYFIALMIGILSTLVTIICRFFKLPPPANYFFIMVACIASYIPNEIVQIPTLTGLLFLGSLLAILLVFLYSVVSLRINFKVDLVPSFERDFQIIIVDSAIIGLLLGSSILIAESFGLQKPYWVTLTCLAIVQGMTFKAAWSRHLQRILGTFIGIALTWFLIEIHYNLWFLSLILTILSFLAESFMGRNYTIGTIFVTPLTIFLAEYAHQNINPEILAQTRFYDTILGATLGVLGAFIIHNKRLRDYFTKVLRIIIPYKNLQSS